MANLTKKLPEVRLDVVRAVVHNEPEKLDKYGLRQFQALDEIDKLFIKLTFASEPELTETEKEIWRLCLKHYEETGVEVPENLIKAANI